MTETSERMPAVEPADGHKQSRREFLSTAGRLAALWGLAATAVPRLAQAVENLSTGQAPVLWLEGANCTGCSVSLLSSYPLMPLSLVTKHLSLLFHQTLSAASGQQAVDTVDAAIDRGGYVLVVEGAVPAGMPSACKFGHENFSDQLVRAAAGADSVISVGACACFGGIPAAPGNQTGATDVRTFLTAQGIDKPHVRVPGCPPHPDWMVGTIVHLLTYGMPSLDADLRPTQFFSRTVHSQCPLNRLNDSSRFGEVGCLVKLGCRGQFTRADCPVRRWNGATSDCLVSGGGCIGCTEPTFAKDGQLFLRQVGVS